MNKQFCSSYTHKRWKHTDSDHSGCDSEDNYPGHKVRKEAYNIMVENHKDKIIQEKEGKEANRLRTNRQLYYMKDNEELDQLHKLIHAGLLQHKMQEGTQLTGHGIVQDKEMQDQQHIAETENKHEEEVHAQEEHHIEDDTADTHILGEQSDH
eukprot:8679792-Heterocapsa_arctica.AAC.1